MSGRGRETITALLFSATREAARRGDEPPSASHSEVEGPEVEGHALGLPEPNACGGEVLPAHGQTCDQSSALSVRNI
jgi:hypothetical protein